MVRLNTGGPLMSVRFHVHDLLLCAWTDAAGRTRRATYSADQLELVAANPILWVRVLARLSSRWPVVAGC